MAYFNSNSWPSAALRDQERFLLFVSIWTFFLTPIYVFGVLKSPSSFIFSIASHGESRRGYDAGPKLIHCCCAAVFLALTWLFW